VDEATEMTATPCVRKVAAQWRQSDEVALIAISATFFTSFKDRERSFFAKISAPPLMPVAKVPDAPESSAGTPPLRRISAFKSSTRAWCESWRSSKVGRCEAIHLLGISPDGTRSVQEATRDGEVARSERVRHK
jgi:hypothetical protein